METTLQLQTCDRDRVAADPSEIAIPKPVIQPGKAVNVELARAASVLVVGDFARMAGITDAALRDLAPRARLLRTVLKSEALHLLSTMPIDLILAVTGPSLATAELTHAMSSLPLPIPMLVIEHSSGLARDRGPREGVERLHVPVNVPELRERIAALLARRAQIVRIEGVSLTGFVQLVEMERRTCTLFVAAERRGTLGFSGGRLVDAQCGEHDGEPAALEILGWPVTTFAYQAWRIQSFRTDQQAPEDPLHHHARHRGRRGRRQRRPDDRLGPARRRRGRPRRGDERRAARHERADRPRARPRQLRLAMLRGSGGYTILTRCGADAVLTVLATDTAKLGLIFLDVTRAAKDIGRLVG
jgi:hypothetical protein